MLNNGLWDMLAVEIDSDLRRPIGEEVIISYKRRKQPRGAKKECPGLDLEGSHFVLDGIPRKCAEDT